MQLAQLVNTFEDRKPAAPGRSALNGPWQFGRRKERHPRDSPLVDFHALPS